MDAEESPAQPPKLDTLTRVAQLSWPKAENETQALLPVIAQDKRSGRVLMLAWVNRQALRQTLETGLATYWSRSRQEIWVKGATSGNYQKIQSVHSDCDGDAILYQVNQIGPACHTGSPDCFFEEMPVE